VFAATTQSTQLRHDDPGTRPAPDWRGNEMKDPSRKRTWMHLVYGIILLHAERQLCKRSEHSALSLVFRMDGRAHDDFWSLMFSGLGHLHDILPLPLQMLMPVQFWSHGTGAHDIWVSQYVNIGGPSFLEQSHRTSLEFDG